MMAIKRQIAAVAAFAVVATGFSSLFVLSEGRQAVVTQFGRPIKVVQTAGLHWKLPFVQDVRQLDMRMLSWDGEPHQIPTRDKKFIVADTTARWRITDPLKFIQTVQNEQRAQSRLDVILDAATRDVVSSHNLVETVRSSNQIFDVLSERQAGSSTAQASPEAIALAEDVEITGEIERVAIGRERLSQMVEDRASPELAAIGVELIDVQLRRIMYEKSVEDKVYQRMISERQRVAEKIRSIGKGEQSKIEGKTQRELQQIEAEAYRQVQEIKGGAEAKAIEVYAVAVERDPAFYKFQRKLEAYKSTIGSDAKVIMSSDANFLDLLHTGPASGHGAPKS